jgi:GT2 family glycosyltransferase
MTGAGVAVVIPNLNGEDILGACLDALGAQTVSPDEVLVVDNASTDGSVELLHDRGVAVLGLARNYGFAGGANRGVAATSSPLVAVLNSDARPQPDWLERLLEHRRREDVWAWGSILISSESGLVESAGDAWSDDGYAYKLGRGMAPADLPLGPYEAFAAPGAAPLFRRDRFDELGGYEERYFLYYEDIDLAYRALLRGWRALIVPTARVEHDLGGSGTRPLVRYHVARNSLWTAIRCVPEPSVGRIARRVRNELRWNRPRSLARHEIRGRAAALVGLPWALRERRRIQAARVLSAQEVRVRLAEPPALHRPDGA